MSTIAKPDLNASLVRNPAEWEPHACCWMAWAVHPRVERLDEQRQKRARGRGAGDFRSEPVCLLTPEGQPNDAQARFSGLDVEIIKAPVHDICIRDIAPTFLRSKDGGLQGYDPGTWIGDSYGAQGCVAGVGVQRLEGL